MFLKSFNQHQKGRNAVKGGNIRDGREDWCEKSDNHQRVDQKKRPVQRV